MRGMKKAVVKKIIRDSLDIKWYRFITKGQNKILADVAYYPEELCDLIILVQPESEEELISTINDWLHLESKLTSNERRYYEVGKAQELMTLVSNERITYNILKETINGNN